MLNLLNQALILNTHRYTLKLLSSNRFILYFHSKL